MKPVPIFTTGGTHVSRIKSREGPTISFICRYKNSCVIKYTKKDIIKFCKLTKGTPTREAFDAWWDTYCETDDNTKLATPLKEGSQAKAKAEAGTTAQSGSTSSEEEDPTKDTKIII